MRLHEKKLTAATRKHLPKSSFVFPKDRKFPIEDKSHARNALSRAAHKGGATEKKVKAAVHRKFPDIGEQLKNIDNVLPYPAGYVVENA